MGKMLQLHGLVERDATQGLPAPRHHIVPCGSFSALVSENTLGIDTAEIPPDVLVQAATAHHDILLAYSENHALLPIRFGTVFSGTTALLNAMEQQHKEYADALRVLSDHREYSLELISTTQPDDPNIPVTTGRSFLKNRLHARAARHSLSQDRQDFAKDLHDRVSVLAIQPSSAGTRKPDSLLKISLLLPKQALSDLRNIAAMAQVGATRLGLSLHIKGPWPAYNFVPTSTEQKAMQNAS